MNLKKYLNLKVDSKPAMKLAGMVLCASFVLHALFWFSSLWWQHGQKLDVLIKHERQQLQSLLDVSDPARLSDPSILINDRLVGLLLTDAVGNAIVKEGDTPYFDDLSYSGKQTQNHRRGSVDAVWFMHSQGRKVLATVKISTGNILQATARNGLLWFLFSLLMSLFVAGLTLWGTTSAYIRPIRRMADLFSENRVNSSDNVLQKIEFHESEDFDVLADEFNDMIEAQLKAARQVKVKQQYLEFAAHHDPLTHLPNRLMFENALKKTVAQAANNDECFTVFLVDMDNFKFFNDQYGHLVGDKMVAEIGNRLQSMMRDVDLVARLDGDEFVVLHNNSKGRVDAEDLARRLMGIATAPYEYRGFTLKVAVSVGISCFPQDVHQEQNEELMGEEVVNNAAVALQEAKSNGKNQFQMFNEKMRSRLTDRIRLEQDLKQAIQDNQFEVYYQPKINIETRQVIGSEALVRWKHPKEGFISPEVFVPVAEEAGMIIELGEWILHTACMETRKLHQLGYDTLNIAVNISAVQFTDGNLLPMVSKALTESKLAPSSLELEITESAVMHDPEEVINSLHELSRFGMRLAIDDFGTGYSSLAYLKRFPVDTLKIDRAFITDISCDNDDVAIVEAVLGLGKHFNMKVVAEGVEDEEQLQFLRSQGCDVAQGYFISKPMPIAVYLAWLRKWPQGVQGVDNIDNVVCIEQTGKLRNAS